MIFQGFDFYGSRFEIIVRGAVVLNIPLLYKKNTETQQLTDFISMKKWHFDEDSYYI
jgi:hypothetical protein